MSDTNDKKDTNGAGEGRVITVRFPDPLWARIEAYKQRLQGGIDIPLERIDSAAIRKLVDGGLTAEGL